MKTTLTFLFFIIGASGHMIPGVPFIRQETNYCGPAALSSVMAFYGVDALQRDIANATFNETLDGALITDLEDFAAGRGFQVKLGQGNIVEIKDLVLQNKPIIALVDLGFWLVSKPHYLVVYGFNDVEFITHDGNEASRQFSYEKFDAIWEKMGRTFLLVYP